MGRFSKEVYKYKTEWAINKHWRSAEKALECGELTEDQVAALSTIASLRHKIHCFEIRSLMNPESLDGDEFYHAHEVIHDLTEANGLPIFNSKINFDYFPCEWDYENNDLDDYEDLDDWYDNSGCVDEAYEMREEFNDEIEQYLKMIDEKYGTEFCPSGYARTLW